MKIKKITIQNYKGIKHIEIPFEFKNGGYIKIPTTLIGLNESGKTSILRAINFLVEDIGYEKIERDIVPKDQKSVFNDSIFVEMVLIIDEKDKQNIIKNIEDIIKQPVVKGSIPREIIFYKKIVFENGNLNKSKSCLGNFDTDSGIKIKQNIKNKSECNLMDKIKQEKYNEIFIKYLPNIVLFETLSSKTPNKIYLGDKFYDEKNETYKNVFNALFSICEPKITVDEIIKRMKSGNVNDKEKTNQTIKKVEHQLDEQVVKEWRRIFGVRSDRAKILINWGCERKGKTCMPYVEIKMQHGNSDYQIKERSLGFNWFFTFLALVYFKGKAGNNIDKQNVFLLDEPANNLHSSAQIRLLGKIGDIAKNNIVVYSTHSQYLINPQWLLNTYVVQNTSITDTGGDTDISAKSADITMQIYNNFVGNSQNKPTHFQPALDAVDYKPSEIEMIKDTIMVEGKNDFFTLKYLIAYYLRDKKLEDISILPGMGAGGLDLPIQLYLAWGRRFIVLLDTDNEGIGSKNRYVNKFGMSIKGQVFTLGDILKNHIGPLEDIFTDKERMCIIKTLHPNEKKYNKKKFNTVLEHMYSTDKKITKGKEQCDLTQDTIDKFQLLLSFLNKKLQGENDPTTNN